MRKKPKGAKYRNLSARGNLIYYQRRERGRKRTRVSTQTDNWDEAVRFRELWEAEEGHRPYPVGDVPLFADMAERYLKEGMHPLAPTTQGDRKNLLKPTGRVGAYFGPMRLDQIGKRALNAFYTTQVEARGRARATGANYLDALSGVLHYAVDLEILESSPVKPFREALHRRYRTQRGRAAADPTRTIRPIDRIHALVEASAAIAAEDEAIMNKNPVNPGAKGPPRRMGVDGHLLTVLLLDTGVRLGEALALRWCDVWWGTNANDTTRALIIEQSRSRGGDAGPTKSGRSRRVALSRRLRSLLRERWMRAGQPDGLILPGIDPRNYGHRHFRRVCERAELGEHKPKDLRDTFASQLVTAGVNLLWVSKQLGHATTAVTEGHYAKWCAGEEYREPIVLEPGEVPPDLLARLGGVRTVSRCGISPRAAAPAP